jgi:GTP cyclohydrolase I
MTMRDKFVPLGDHFTPQSLIAEVLSRIHDSTLDEPSMADTPDRVVKSWKELYGGYRVDVSKLFTTFESPCDTMVVVSDIEFYSTCEHHMLPFIGKAHIGYIPNGKVLGLSKMPRILDAYSRRFQIQERIGEQVVTAMMDHLKPLGAICVIEAKHLCMCARGVAKQHSVTRTSALAGAFKEDPAARAEFMSLMRGPGA